MATKHPVRVTASALIKRINRKLAADGEVLKVTRGQRALLDLGNFYVLDINMNAVMRKDLDIEEFGRRRSNMEASITPAGQLVLRFEADEAPRLHEQLLSSSAGGAETIGRGVYGIS